MMILRAIILSLVLLTSMSLQAQEQNFAHVNLGNVLELLPETAEAEKKMENLRDSLVMSFEDRVAQLEEDFGVFQREVAEGNISRVNQQKKEQQFQQEQQELGAFERSMQQRLEREREKVLGPILEKVNTVITNLAKENNYTFVFDISGGSLLFAEESKDISGEVLDRLRE
jgi:outer membrane protein